MSGERTETTNTRRWLLLAAIVLVIAPSSGVAGPPPQPGRGPATVPLRSADAAVAQEVQLARGATRPAAPREPYVWHVLVAGPEKIVLDPHPSRVVLRGRDPAHQAMRTWNRRQIFTERNGVRSTNQTVCATWRSQSADAIQQGLAVRVRGQARDGRQRAITLTKNTYTGYFWVFNLVTWDSSRRGDPWRAIGQFDMSQVLVRNGHWVPLPWRVCLRVHDRTVSFKVWLPGDEPEPRWDDASHARHARLAPRFVMRGRPGWYVGHLPAGQVTAYSSLSTAGPSPGRRRDRPGRLASP